MSIIEILLGILVIGVVLWAIFWLIDMIAGNLPAGAGQIIKVIVALIALIYVIGVATGSQSLPRLY